LHDDVYGSDNTDARCVSYWHPEGVMIFHKASDGMLGSGRKDLPFDRDLEA
jgi:hypothetical protein